MQYVYVLFSEKDKQLYVGCTQDMKKRIQEHNRGRVDSTKLRRPLKMLYYEAFTDKSDAFIREQWLKTGWGRSHLHKLLLNTLENLGG